MGGRGHFEAQKLTFTRRKIDAVNRGVHGLCSCAARVRGGYTLIILLSVLVLLNDLVWNFSKNLY